MTDPITAQSERHTLTEEQACDDCKHQIYDHISTGCRVERSDGTMCECKGFSVQRRRTATVSDPITALVAKFRKESAQARKLEDRDNNRYAAGVGDAYEWCADELDAVRQAQQGAGDSRPAGGSEATCPSCGHRHAGERMAFICIGCPCPRTSLESATTDPAVDPVASNQVEPPTRDNSSSSEKL